MKDFEALKNIWSNQTDRSKISPEDILKRVKQSKSHLANKLSVEIIVMLTAIFILSYAWITVPFKMWTSHIAIAIFIICCIYVMFEQYIGYRKIIDSASLLNRPGEYITYLKLYKRDRHILNTRKYGMYTLFLSVGVALFFVEIFFIAELWVTTLGILFTLAWFFFCYSILMKNYILREENRLEDMIANLGRLEKQFTDEAADLIV